MSRNRNMVTSFPNLGTAVASWLKAESALLDGEIV
jgi:ATP-dependent DNA ligase